MSYIKKFDHYVKDEIISYIKKKKQQQQQNS